MSLPQYLTAAELLAYLSPAKSQQELDALLREDDQPEPDTADPEEL